MRVMMERAGRFERWVALAMSAHALGALLAWAGLVPSEMRQLAQALRRTQRELLAESVDVGVAQEAVPVPRPAAPPPPPAPAEEPSAMLPAPVPPRATPRPAEPPSAEPPVPEPL